MVHIMYIMLNSPEYKAAGFVYVKKLLAHKFDPFPAVTLREFC